MAKHTMSTEEAQRLGDLLGVNWQDIPLAEFRRGLRLNRRIITTDLAEIRYPGFGPERAGFTAG